MRDLELKLGGHEKFQELCALYPTGSLSEPELASLCQHLETCEGCRRLLAEYRALDRTVVPFLAKHPEGPVISNHEETKQRLFASLEGAVTGPLPSESALRSSRLRPLPVQTLALAASVLLAVLLVSGISYMAGLHKGSPHLALEARSHADPVGSDPSAARIKLDDQVKERDTRIGTLSSEIAQQSKEISRLKTLLDQSAADDQQTKSELLVAQAQQSDSATDRDALRAQLKDAQTTLVSLQGQLRQTLDERTSDLMQTASLQRRIDDLNSQVEEQRTLLTSDRDIRELMGARDLFIADVFDIARDGTTKMPFGRVFYTKNKSLVFYAFDLDKQQDVRTKTDVAFQVWGQNDTDKRQALNLGIFYMDNQANRRWVLKFDDPSVLERINAVFVTVEPSGGSPKPSGKQLLYAYLEAQPNHP
jgi:hypothetical protein